MNPNREELLFQLALTKLGDERADFLARECRNDAALRARLEALLAAHEQPDELLGEGAAHATIEPTMKIECAEERADEAVGQKIGRIRKAESCPCGLEKSTPSCEPANYGRQN